MKNIGKEVLVNTIQTAEWEKIAPLWAKWRRYNLSDMSPPAKREMGDTWIDAKNIFRPEEIKTLLFSVGGVPVGCLRIRDFSGIYPRIKVAGIGNVAVDPAFRGNGIGKSLMEIADIYQRFFGYQVSILYSSQYTKQLGFYESLGYTVEGKVLVKCYGAIALGATGIKTMAKNAGKF